MMRCERRPGRARGPPSRPARAARRRGGRWSSCSAPTRQAHDAAPARRCVPLFENCKCFTKNLFDHLLLRDDVTLYLLYCICKCGKLCKFLPPVLGKMQILSHI